jgi:hypothetical protein
MPAPSALARVYAAAKRFMMRGLPSWEDDSSSILRELWVLLGIRARL